MEPALSFVIPMYNAASTIEAVVREIEALDIRRRPRDRAGR